MHIGARCDAPFDVSSCEFCAALQHSIPSCPPSNNVSALTSNLTLSLTILQRSNSDHYGLDRVWIGKCRRLDISRLSHVTQDEGEQKSSRNLALTERPHHRACLYMQRAACHATTIISGFTPCFNFISSYFQAARFVHISRCDPNRCCWVVLLVLVRGLTFLAGAGAFDSFLL